MNSVFEEARRRIDRSTIERFVPAAPGSHWDDQGEYWTTNPMRNDRKVGSFHVSEQGHWFDHATNEGGDLIDLVVATQGVSKREAAKLIAGQVGGPEDNKTRRSSSRNRPKRKREKVPAQTPVPESAGKALNAYTGSDYYRKNHGAPTAGWKYLDSEGNWLFAVVRFERPKAPDPSASVGEPPTEIGGKDPTAVSTDRESSPSQSGRSSETVKDVLPFYFGTDGRWHQGQIADHDRPLFNLDRLASDPDAPVLVVEGEKCASVEVAGYVLVTWPGGSGPIAKADWSPLSERVVVMWPDADKPGRKAASALQKRLPHAEVLDVWREPHPVGWDIADAVAEGLDIGDFIESTPRLPIDETPPAQVPAGDPFRCLGFDDEFHVFLLSGQRVVRRVPRGKWSAAQLGELAPLSWWALHGFVTEHNTIRVQPAEDHLIAESTKQGRYNPSLIRGAGVWTDAKRLVINNGHELVSPDGATEDLGSFPTRYYYTGSSATFGALTGEEATADEGWKLTRLVDAQDWLSPPMSLAVLGWCLIAPFGGVLEWRPHIWITGKKTAGKSYTLENIVAPLVGDFAHEGSGRDSEAGIRRTLQHDARPVILDECEPRTKNDQDNIDRILTLARNASSNHSARVTMSKPGGGVETFVVRSCFCFASIQMPRVDAAIASRVIQCELKPHADMGAKKTKTAEFISAMREPRRYRARIFRRLEQILEDIAWLRDELLPHLTDQRLVDQWSPLLAAAWHVAHDDPITSENGREWLELFVQQISQQPTETGADEDELWDYLLSSQIDYKPGERRTIAEALLDAFPNSGSSSQSVAEAAVGRVGLRFVTTDGYVQLAVRTKHPKLIELLQNTNYSAGYADLLRRNPLCVNPEAEGRRVRIGGQSTRARMFDWTKFRVRYLGSDE